MLSGNVTPESFYRCSHVDPNSLFAAFTNVQISMIATELANGRSLSVDAIDTICDTAKQERMLGDFVADALACPIWPFNGESDHAFAVRFLARAESNFETFMESL